jgi:hypothetical protein
VVWATGFRPCPKHFLDPIANRLEREGDEHRIDEDFSVQWDGPADRRIFMLNAARRQRGLPDPNLSLLAWRSQRVVDRMRGVRALTAPQVIFQQPPGELARVKELLGLNDVEADVISNLRTGTALWRVNRRSVLVRHQLTEDEALIVNTDARMTDFSPGDARAAGGYA